MNIRDTPFRFGGVLRVYYYFRINRMEIYKGYKVIEAANRSAWREWLKEYHYSEKSIWLIIYKKNSGISSIYYDEAVDEALCFGWVDSKPNKRDSKSYYQFFARRNPKSNWSKINKEKIERLTKEGLMQKAGLKMVEEAKKSGTWEALNEVENLIIPADLQILFDKHKVAFNNYNAFPRSSKRIILEWIFNAKRPATRKKRIMETVEKAEQNIRANHYRQ